MIFPFENGAVEKGSFDHVFNLYRVYGHEKVSYENYVKSREAFDAKVARADIVQADSHVLARTRREILEQSETQRGQIILKALKSPDIEIQRLGASLVQYASECDRAELGQRVYEDIVKSLASPDIQVQRIGVNMIQFAPSAFRDELRTSVLRCIVDAFSSEDVGRQRIMAKKIGEAPLAAQSGLREEVYLKATEALQSNDLRVQRLGAVMARYAPEDKQAELARLIKAKFETAKRQGRSNEIAESSLYVGSNDDVGSSFSHEIFSKTGSATTLLLGKQFKDNLIFRHMEEPCLTAWRKAYESYESWVGAGFDYVPIEPIYSFSYSKGDGLTNVASGVLDINLEEWYAFSGDSFKEELDRRKGIILEVLSRLGIDHGHANNANFCLSFWRDEHGNADIGRLPRIYLIDFDKATKN